LSDRCVVRVLITVSLSLLNYDVCCTMFEIAVVNSWLQESDVSSTPTAPRLPPPRVADKQAKKPRKWTRLRFKKTRRQLDPVATGENGYPSATRSVVEVDAESSVSDNSGLPCHKTIADDNVLSY